MCNNNTFPVVLRKSWQPCCALARDGKVTQKWRSQGMYQAFSGPKEINDPWLGSEKKESMSSGSTKMGHDVGFESHNNLTIS